ncbi:hypothetical protein BC829DRAFT_1960 [Chytridium lagenaria]|nr:hypothetical protein BC829DRAFT_1960 [Chytridium lagenaria]
MRPLISSHLLAILLSHILQFLLLHPTGVTSQGADHDPPSWSDISNAYCGFSKSCGTILQTASTTEMAYTKGLPSVFFMQFIASNKTSQVGNTTSSVGIDIIRTASFYPFVDEYSEMVVPGSFPLLTQWSLSTLNVPKIQMVLFFRGQLFKTGMVSWTRFSDGGLHYVPARTVRVTLRNGVPTENGVMWEPTSCTLATCTCIDNICGQLCTERNSCNITVRVGWQGTDANGAILTSSSLDIWRFQNAF